MVFCNDKKNGLLGLHHREREVHINHYGPSASFTRLYDDYRYHRLVAQDDKLRTWDDSFCYLPWYRDVALKKCYRLLFKLKKIRTYQTLIESHEILKKALIEAERKKPLYTVFRDENPINDDDENERTLAILRVIAGVIELADSDIARFAYKLGKAKKVTMSEKSYNLARELKASLERDGFNTGGSHRHLSLLLRLRMFLGAERFPIDEIDTFKSYEEVARKHERGGYQITPSKKNSTARQLFIREATLLSRQYLRFKGKNRFPAEAIQPILEYIDGTHTDIRSIKRIQADYDQEIINKYFEMGEYDKAAPLKVMAHKQVINPYTGKVHRW